MIRQCREPIHGRAPVLFRRRPIVNRDARWKFPQDIDTAFHCAGVLKLPPAGLRRVLHRGGESVIPRDHKQPHDVLVFGIVNMSPAMQKVEHTSVATSTLTATMTPCEYSGHLISAQKRTEAHSFYGVNGSANETIVPRSGRESICMVPPSRWMRSSIPRSPRPVLCDGVNPLPSSCTDTRRRAGEVS